MNKIILALLVISCSISCVNNSEEEIQTIDLTSGLEKPIKIRISEIAEDVEFIFLETTESSLIGNIRDIHITNKHILILDRSLFKALLFTRQGEFVTNIGTRGAGPDEYTQILDCCFTTSGQEIALLCNPKRRTQIYDLKGNLISSFPTECHPNGISSFDNKLIHHIGYPNNVAYNNGYSINILDEANNEIKLLNRESGLPSIPIFLQLFNLNEVNSHLSIWEAYYDTIYYMNKSLKVFPGIALKHSEDYIFANGLVPMDEYNQKLASGYGILNLLDCDNYLFISFSVRRKFENTIYDKSSNRLYHIRDRYLINDIAGPRHLWPNTVLRNNVLCFYNHITDLKKLKNTEHGHAYIDTIKEEQYQRQLSLADEYDNQCIILAKLKRNHSIGK